MTDIVTAAVKGVVRNPVSASMAVGTESQLALGAHSQQLVSDVHGKWFEANLRGKLFTANVTAVTIPAVASGMVSVFTLWNPPGSGVNGEIVSVQLGDVLASDVVGTVGWYSSNASLTALGTFTTLASPRSSNVQGSAANAVKFYSAYTHSGTPIREDIITSLGAVTDTNVLPIEKNYDGKLILPPGIAMSVGATAAMATTGTDIQVTWAEWPV